MLNKNVFYNIVLKSIGLFVLSLWPPFIRQKGLEKGKNPWWRNVIGMIKATTPKQTNSQATCETKGNKCSLSLSPHAYLKGFEVAQCIGAHLIHWFLGKVRSHSAFFFWCNIKDPKNVKEYNKKEIVSHNIIFGTTF